MKEKAIRSIVDTAVKVFADTFSEKHISQASDPEGVINSKKNNCFMAALGNDFMIYSALSISFDSSLGTMPEAMGRNIAKLSYRVLDDIDSILLPEQDQHIRNIISSYDRRDEYPKVSHYDSFTAIIPRVTDSYRQTHKTDNFFMMKIKTHITSLNLKQGEISTTKRQNQRKVKSLENILC